MTVANLAESLITALRQPGQERLRELVRNPLCLTLLCHIWDGSALPETQGELYGRYVKKFYSKFYIWSQNLKKLETYVELCQKNLHAEPWQTDIEKLEGQLHKELGELAKEALNNPQEGFRLSQSLVEKYLGKKNNKQSLCYLALELGWLNWTGRDNRGDIFAFYHATFQEYFAALAVKDWDDFLPRYHVNFPVEGKKYRIFEPQWKLVILLWLGRKDMADKKKEEFINKLVSFNTGCYGDFYYYHAFFLAAAGINEFKTYPFASEIVKQLVKGKFGEFDTEKQQWITFPSPITRQAGKIIPKTIRQLAITELIKIIETQDYHQSYIIIEVVYSLCEIGQGNPQLISELIRIIKTTDNENIYFSLIRSLGEIAQENIEAIAYLIQILETTEDGFTRWKVAETLARIARRSPEAITELVRILNTPDNKKTWLMAAVTLGKIDLGNSIAIAALIQMLEANEKEDIIISQIARVLGQVAPENPEAILALSGIIQTYKNYKNKNILIEAAVSLGKIDPGNLEAITALVEILETTKDEDILKKAVYSSCEIAQENSSVIAILVHIVKTSKNESLRSLAGVSLGKIAKGNSIVVEALIDILKTPKDDNITVQVVEILSEVDPINPQLILVSMRLLETTKNEKISWQAANILSKTAEGNLDVIAALERILKNDKYEHIHWLVAYSLGKIDPRNLDAITVLISILATPKNEDIYKQVVWSLGETTKGNTQAIAALIRILKTTENESTRGQAAESLQKMLATSEQYAGVVSALKDCLSDEVYQNNFDQFNECYKVLWECAANLPYPDFYHAWHSTPEKP